MPHLARPAFAPKLPPEHRKTWAIVRPRNDAGAGTFWRPVGCEEYGCAAYQHGWTTTLELAAHAAQVHYIRRESGRRFTEEAAADGRVTFRFAPGQPCFRASEHQVPVEREPLFVVREGDSRGNPRGTAPMRHASAEDWRDHFAEHQDQLHTAAQEG